MIALFNKFKKLFNIHQKILENELDSLFVDNKLMDIILDSAGFANYDDWLLNARNRIDGSCVDDLKFILKLDDSECLYLVDIIGDIDSSYYQAFVTPRIVHEIKYVLTFDYRWGRVYFEKIYYDLFHKDKAFRWDLLKYLQKDGETVILPEIPGRVITSKKEDKSQTKSQQTTSYLSNLSHSYTFQDAINEENPIIMALFGGKSTDEAATFVLDTLKNYFSKNQFFNPDFPKSKYSKLTQKGYYFSKDLEKLIRELEKILELKNKELHNILDLPKEFNSPDPEMPEKVKLEIQDVRQMLEELIIYFKSRLQSGEGINVKIN